jgi:hypothetical protein
MPRKWLALAALLILTFVAAAVVDLNWLSTAPRVGTKSGDAMHKAAFQIEQIIGDEEYLTQPAELAGAQIFLVQQRPSRKLLGAGSRDASSSDGKADLAWVCPGQPPHRRTVTLGQISCTPAAR